MSGDAGTAVIVEAAAAALQSDPSLKLLLVGNRQHIESCLTGSGTDSLMADGRVEIVEADEVVTMEDSVSVALRSKKNSSMRVAVNQVKEGTAGACVSAGNTAALVAISKFVLKTLPGIDRPAICTVIPAMHGGHTHMLDLGATTDCTPQNLLQFAVMGSVLTGAVDALDSPKVGLLNIGSEDLKGNELVKETAVLLQQSSLNYVGYVEGDEIYTDKADVIVCDGFVGNVSLKTSEGVARMVSHYLKDEFTRTPLNKLIGLLARPVLLAFRNRINPAKYNGATLLGLRGVVIKSHGGADAQAFANAIKIAHLEIAKNVPELIGQQVENHLPDTANNARQAT